MLKDENRCHFNIIAKYADFNPNTGYYGYIVDFKQEEGEGSYQGVLAPLMRTNDNGETEWVLFPMWCVEIKERPREPIKCPAYEVDE